VLRKYKLIVAYDGTDFAGWQIQDTTLTVAGCLHKTFKAAFNSEIHLAAASRTDAGVHALGQTAIFYTDLLIDVATMHFAWRNILPSTILIRSIQEVPLDWNPRHNVVQKTYYYHFFDTQPLPFAARYGFHYRKNVAIEKLKEALALFVGTHDFRSFCSGNDLENTVRTIDSATVEYISRFKVYRITIKGPGFLRYMIRRIVGACLEVASRDTLLADLKSTLDKKNPQHHFVTAPARGLLLAKIVYKP
jgi:tRNA pseudouridine38-40 synthase